MNVAYLANSFPEPIESYVWEEIRGLRECGVNVTPCSIRRPRQAAHECGIPTSEVEYLFPLRLLPSFRASWLLIRHAFALQGFIWRAISGPEKFSRRMRTLAHTWLGAYLAARLARKQISRIHVHHGYFGAWVGMVAARILGAGFSVTLHGSDLLIRADYLDAKLAACDVCFTVSEFNRRYILEHFSVAPHKIRLRRLGVDPARWQPDHDHAAHEVFSILSVGRLHAVKDHAFLLLACHALQRSGVNFHCRIAGEGEERRRLETLISSLDLRGRVTLLGQVRREQLRTLYSTADAVVLTSRSEGVPVALMEAMAMERIVIAPNISGIPELITDGVNGFLYSPGSVKGLVAKLQFLYHHGSELTWIRHAAREQIVHNFNGPANLARYAEEFLAPLETKAVPVQKLHRTSLLSELATHD